MSAAPKGWHTVTTRIVVGEDVAALVRFLKRVFGGTGKAQPNAPAQVRIGDSLLMVSEAGPRDVFPAFLYVYVDDADATCRRALRAGAVSLEACWDTPYGDRRGMVRDPWGNVWQVAHRARARVRALRLKKAPPPVFTRRRGTATPRTRQARRN